MQASMDSSITSSITSEGKSLSSKNRNVSFSSISIREYDISIGDNPSCSSGNPISLGWNVSTDTKDIDVDEFEQERELQRSNSSKDLRLSRDDRRNMLSDAGYSMSELVKQHREVLASKDDRAKNSKRSLGKDTYEKIKEFCYGRLSKEKRKERDEWKKMKERIELGFE